MVKQDTVWGEESEKGMENDSNGMYQFLVAFVKDYQKSNGLKPHRCIILQFWMPESKIVLTRLKSGWQQGCVPM